ncbi:MAG: sugar phosphate isomerase/epimerase [Opitutaceae bacterium]|nr:sugar phosphate isomerase/epimerase [Opitutaceae bacterium]
MKLGFVSAIFADLDLNAVLAFAREAGFSVVEPMCWPTGKAERRYAGVTHVDVSALDAAAVRAHVAASGVGLSALGYYPNPLVADEREAAVCIAHLRRVISAAPQLGLDTVNTFVGRDPRLSPADNWRLFDERWPDIVRHAEACGVRIAIENCPMFFSLDEYPGGKNLAHTPRAWREMFNRIPSANFGLNYDPSHLVWQFIDPVAPIREFGSRIFHVHAKDASIDREALQDVGVLATPLEFHRPRLPGLGAVDWAAFFNALREARYAGPVCIEVEDRAYEGPLERRQEALHQSLRLLRELLPA